MNDKTRQSPQGALIENDGGLVTLDETTADLARKLRKELKQQVVSTFQTAPDAIETVRAHVDETVSEEHRPVFHEALNIIVRKA